MEEHEKLRIGLISLSKLSAEVIAEDFYLMELYKQWKSGDLREVDFLYRVVNHLSEAYRMVRDKNVEYFVKYELGNEIGESPSI